MKRAAEIIARPTPEGLTVCVPGYLGIRRFSDAGATLKWLDLLILARMAGQQGARLVIEIQGDGGPIFPLDLPPEWKVEP